MEWFSKECCSSWLEAPSHLLSHDFISKTTRTNIKQLSPVGICCHSIFLLHLIFTKFNRIKCLNLSWGDFSHWNAYKYVHILASRNHGPMSQSNTWQPKIMRSGVLATVSWVHIEKLRCWSNDSNYYTNWMRAEENIIDYDELFITKVMVKT